MRDRIILTIIVMAIILALLVAAQTELKSPDALIDNWHRDLQSLTLEDG